jgi:hypothetical protein
MASKAASIERLRVQDLFVRTASNGLIPNKHILISNGDGSTYWNSVSTIFPVSSFKTVIGGDSPLSTFSADVNYNVLLVSTTAIPNTFASYVDPTTSSLMLSLNFPPLVVSGGSVNNITNTFNVPNSNAMAAQSLTSTVKFYGTRDIIFSTVNTQQAVYIAISSFSAAGYSTIYGEMQNNPKVSVSSFSTVFGSPQSLSFVSSIPFTLADGGAMSTSGTSLYTSSLQFDAGHIAKYVNMSTLNTKICLEYYPNYIFPTMVNESDTMNTMSSIKPITSFLQGANGQVYPETSNVRYMTSQQISTPTYQRALSNVYTDTIKMDVNPYTLSTSVGNVPNLKLAMYHQIENCYNNSPSNVTLTSNVYLNNTLSTNGLYLHVYNQPLVPAAQVPAIVYSTIF